MQDHERGEPQSVQEADGCPTEGAVLKREWRRLTTENAALRAAVESLAPKENQRVFAVNVLGTPMREYEPGKWEVARWPSLAAPAGDEWPLPKPYAHVWRSVPNGYTDVPVFSAEQMRAHARQRVLPASEEQPKQPGTNVHLVRGDAARPDGSEGREACWMARNGYSCACAICSAAPAPIPSTAPASPGPDVESASAPAADEQALPVVRGSHIKASMFHDAGAVARCSYCRRYSDDPATLSDRQPLCDCGKRHGWCGSFVAPTADSKWSGASPVSAPEPASQRELLRECENALVAAKEVMSWIDENSHNPPTVRYARENEQKADAALAKLREHLNLKEKS